MAENKKKGAADDTASASRASSKGSKFSETLSKIVGLLGDLKSDTAGASEFEKMVENQKMLDKNIKARDAEIKTLRLSIENLEHSQDILLTSFGKRYREYDDKLSNDEALKSTVTKAQESLTTALAEAKKLKTENKSLHTKVNKLEASLEKSKDSSQASKAECDRLKLELGLSDAKFDQLSRFIGETKLIEFDHETLVTVFEAFATKCHNLAVTCFRDNEVPTASVDSIVEHLECYLGHHRPKLPLSTSMQKPARLMRCAAAEFVISSALDKHIFPDIYETDGIQDAIGTTLGFVALKDDRRESVVRCQLLAQSEDTSETVTRVVNDATREVCTALSHLLPAGRQREDFQKAVHELFEEGVTIWKPLQGSKYRVMVEFVNDLKEFEHEDRHPDYDEASSDEPTRRNGQNATADRQAVLPLFPQISIRDVILKPGIALWSDQGAFVEAKTEVDRLSVSRAVGGPASRPPVARRRMSIPRGAQSPPTKGTATFVQPEGTVPASGHCPAAARNHVSPSTLVGKGLKAAKV